jgi:hypothetical protein
MTTATRRRCAALTTLAAILAGCASTQPVTAVQDGTLALPAVAYAGSLRPHFERALYACQGTTSTAGSGAFTWSGWIGQNGAVGTSVVKLAAPETANPLARCVLEKLKRTRMPVPSTPAPFDAGFPASFSWTPLLLTGTRP